jgi:hypothetical protein
LSIYVFIMERLPPGKFNTGTFSLIAPTNDVHNVKKQRTNAYRYPIFISLATYLDDVYWVDQFNQYANAKFPPHFSIKDKEIRFRNGNKQPSRQKLIGEPEILAHDIVNFFQVNAGLYSTSVQEEVEEDISITWSDISLQQRRTLFKQYIDQLVIKYKLNLKQTNNLISRAMLAFDNSKIKAEYVFFNGKAITNITCIKYNPTTNDFKLPDFTIKNTKSSAKKEEVNPLKDLTKYLLKIQSNRLPMTEAE